MTETAQERCTDPDYHNASPAILTAYAEEMDTSDLVIFAFKASDIGPFVEIVAGDVVVDTATGKETLKEQKIRLSPSGAADLAAKLVDAAGQSVGSLIHDRRPLES